MKTYDFDRVIDRHNTNSVKYDLAGQNGIPADALPLWVADMDFPAPDGVLEALHGRIDHGIFGYSTPMADYYQAVAGWFWRRFGWQAEKEWLVTTPGVVFALSTAVRALTKPGDSVLIQPPVYYPFARVVKKNDRRVVESPLVYENGRYTIDFADFEQKIRDNSVKMFILCSPHNPVGRVWTVEELREIGKICQRHGVLVVSDEIHCDFAFPEHGHTMFLQANPDMAERTVLCTAPSKTFNLAGLQCSNIWIPSPALRTAFTQEMGRVSISELNTLALTACQAAYTTGEDWLNQCTAYLRENLAYVRQFLRSHLPEIALVEPEGTYFAWLDCSGLGLSEEALDDLILHKARLWLDAGHMFGVQGSQFQRVVLACPRSVLAQAMTQLERAVRER
jgi:cystathionine beta-lyase